MGAFCVAERGTRGLRRIMCSETGRLWRPSPFAAIEDLALVAAVVIPVLWLIQAPRICLRHPVCPCSTSPRRPWKLWSLVASWNRLHHCTNRYRSRLRRSDKLTPRQRGPPRYRAAIRRLTRRGTSVLTLWSVNRRQTIRIVAGCWISARRSIGRSGVRRRLSLLSFRGFIWSSFSSFFLTGTLHWPDLS